MRSNEGNTEGTKEDIFLDKKEQLLPLCDISFLKEWKKLDFEENIEVQFQIISIVSRTPELLGFDFLQACL